MKAFMRIEGVPGQSTDKDHKDWIILNSVSSPIRRTIKEGARDVERTQGTTTLGNVGVDRRVDKSSVKLSEYCASGKYIPEVELDICNVVNNKVATVYKYRLTNVIVVEYTFNYSAEGDAGANEHVEFNFEKVEWTYTIINPKTGDSEGDIVGRYNPGEGSAA